MHTFGNCSPQLPVKGRLGEVSPSSLEAEKMLRSLSPPARDQLIGVLTSKTWGTTAESAETQLGGGGGGDIQNAQTRQEVGWVD